MKKLFVQFHLKERQINVHLPYVNQINPKMTHNLHIKVTGYISGRGNHAQLDSAYLTRRNSQTSQIGPGKRPRMYTMQTARAVVDPGTCIQADIWWSIPTQTSRQIAQQR